MAIEINGEVYRTEAQWERRHRHVNKRCRGVERTWRSPRGGNDSAVFYSEEQTRPWTEAEKRRERKAKAAAKHAREDCGGAGVGLSQLEVSKDRQTPLFAFRGVCLSRC